MELVRSVGAAVAVMAACLVVAVGAARLTAEHDVNDNRPVFQFPRYTKSLLENSPAGELVVTVKALDADSGLSGELRYGLSGDPLAQLAIVPVTGVVTTTAVLLDAEAALELRVSVTVVDLGNPRLEAVASELVITVVDVNDNDPRLVPAYYEFDYYNRMANSRMVVLGVARKQGSDASSTLNHELKL